MTGTRTGYRLLLTLAVLAWLPAQASRAAESFTSGPLNDQQVQRLFESAAEAPDSPDHDFAAKSIHHLLEQAKQLELTPEQTDKIKRIGDHYAQTKARREAVYKEAEMEALKLIHDRHSSLSAVESAVHHADEEHSKLRMVGITAWRKAADVLRPEQYTQWRQSYTARNMTRSAEGPASGEAPDPERLAPH